MRSTIDRAGRVVIPKQIRDEAGLQADTPLEVRYRDGRIEIEIAPLPVRLEKRGRVAVLIPETGSPPKLTVETVNKTQRRLRQRSE